MKTYIDFLRRELEVRLDEATLFDVDCPLRLGAAIRYSLLGSGKRLRPLFVIFATEMCGGNRDSAMPAACAVEMIHAYSLIHDDLPAMDNDDLRRGRPTCHKQFDEATAILAGDALIPFAFEMLSKLSPDVVGRCSLELARAAGASALVGGQMDDIEKEKDIDTKQQEPAIKLLERIHQRKTGALIRVSLRLGGIIAGASDEWIAGLDNFGQKFGLAFQITDDLLDVLGNEETVGKRLRKDAAMDKWTYPALLGIEESKSEALRNINEAIAELSIFDNSIAKEILTNLTRNLIGREK
ncbi:MAG: polyprenyl synthetase family protein [Planctomycetaceae bacterium]|jgi:geranylgeranyl diphosphate synthase type II|nr:polyprenyl synthetase family protein [Planctomycetaceae bacterium]